MLPSWRRRPYSDHAIVLEENQFLAALPITSLPVLQQRFHSNPAVRLSLFQPTVHLAAPNPSWRLSQRLPYRRCRNRTTHLAGYYRTALTILQSGTGTLRISPKSVPA